MHEYFVNATPNEQGPTETKKSSESRCFQIKSDGNATTATGKELQIMEINHQDKKAAAEQIVKYVTETRKLDLDTFKNLTDVEMFLGGKTPGVMFHYRQGGQLMGTKVRTADDSKKTFWINRAQQVQNGREEDIPIRIFYGQEMLETYNNTGKCSNHPLIICEGEYDRIAWLSIFPNNDVNVISVPHGAPKNADLLEEHLEHFKHVKEIYLAFDNDPAGNDAANRYFYFLHDFVSRQSSKRRRHLAIRRVKFPQEWKDANDVIIGGDNGNNEGRLILAELFQKAEEMDVPDTVSFPDTAFKWGKRTRYLKTGTPMDQVLTIPSTELTMIQGYTGHGKSEFATWLTYQLAVTNNFKVCTICLETSPERLRESYLAYYYADKTPKKVIEKHLVIDPDEPPQELKEGEQWATPEQIEEFEQFNAKYVRYMRQPEYATSQMDEECLKDFIIRHALAHDVKIFVVDPFNQIARTQEELDHHRIRKFFGDLKQICHSYGIAIIVCAHPKTPKEKRDANLPDEYTLSGGNEMSNALALLISIHYHPDDKYDNKFCSTLSINKGRDIHKSGMKFGHYPIMLHPRTMKYHLTDSLRENPVEGLEPQYPAKPGVLRQHVEDSNVQDISRYRSNEVNAYKRARSSPVEAIDESDY